VPLHVAVDAVIVGLVGSQPPTAVPVAGIRQELVHEAQAGLRRRRFRVGVMRHDERIRADGEQHRVRVVHRHPSARYGLGPERAGRRLRPERKQELGEARIELAVARGPIATGEHAVIGIRDLVFDRRIVGVERASLRPAAAGRATVMQQAGMRA
jgi:hypothetical protein